VDEAPMVALEFDEHEHEKAQRDTKGHFWKSRTSKTIQAYLNNEPSGTAKQTVPDRLFG